MTALEISQKIGGRKIAVWGVSVLVSTVLLWFGKIENSMWTDLHIWTTMSLLAANALTHVAQAFKK